MSTPVNTPVEPNLFVNFIPLSAGEQELRERFTSYGDIVSLRVIRHHPPHGSTMREAPSKGYGFVRFASIEHARAAIAGEHGVVWENKRLSVSLATTRGDRAVHDDEVSTSKKGKSGRNRKTVRPPRQRPDLASPPRPDSKECSSSSSSSFIATNRSRSISITMRSGFPPIDDTLPALLRVLSCFGQIEALRYCQREPITVTFADASQAMSALHAIQGNVIHAIHPTIPLHAIQGNVIHAIHPTIPLQASSCEHKEVLANSRAQEIPVVALHATPTTRNAPFALHASAIDSIEASHSTAALPHTPADPLTAAFSTRPAKELPQPHPTKQGGGSVTSPVRRINAPYAPIPVPPPLPQLPIPYAHAGGYVDGYGTGTSLVAPTFHSHRRRSCAYCAGVTTLIVQNTPSDDEQCTRLLDEQFSSFGPVKFIECWCDGEAVVGYFSHSDATAAVEALHESEYHADFFDCGCE